MCKDFDTRLVQATDMSKDKYLLKGRNEYFSYVREERLYYDKENSKVNLRRKQARSIIVDGVDQLAFDLPHLVVISKNNQKHVLKGWPIRRIDYLKLNKLFFTVMKYEHDTSANYVNEVAHYFINNQAGCRPLPPTMFIWHDNGTRESKIWNVPAYLQFMKHWSVSQYIEAAFLPIGLKQENIDQAFSKT